MWDNVLSGLFSGLFAVLLKVLIDELNSMKKLTKLKEAGLGDTVRAQLLEAKLRDKLDGNRDFSTSLQQRLSSLVIGISLIGLGLVASRYYKEWPGAIDAGPAGFIAVLSFSCLALAITILVLARKDRSLQA